MSWCALWRIQINETKTTAVYFSRKHLNPNRLTINNKTIPCSNEAKYLGVTLDKRLTWKQHILNIRGRAMNATKAISPLLRSNELSHHNRLLLYNACVLSILTYASPIWGFACNTSMNLLSCTHNKNLRNVRDASRYLRNTVILRDLNTITFKKRVTLLSNNFFNDVFKLNNEIIAELPDYEASNPSFRKRPRYSTILSG